MNQNIVYIFKIFNLNHFLPTRIRWLQEKNTYL